MFRFSLGALLLLVFFAALGCAALVYPSDVWRHILVTLAMASLLFATVLAVIRRDQRQTFAIGFALVGWIYLISMFTPIVDIRNHLLTTQIVEWLGKRMHGDGQVTSGQVLVGVSSDIWQDIVFSNVSSHTGSLLQLVRTPQSVTPANFVVIGHSLWTLILACVGGMLACYLSRRNETKPEGVT